VNAQGTQLSLDARGEVSIARLEVSIDRALSRMEASSALISLARA